MAFGDTIQSDDNTAVSGEATINFPSAATAGNLLIVVEGRGSPHSAGGAWGAPAEWNVIHDTGINTGNFAGALYYKIAAGGETSFTTSHTNEQGNWQCSFAEFEGPFAASPLDVSAEDATHLTTVVTSQSTGTTGTTAQNDELAIAAFSSDVQSTIDGAGTRNYSNSFSEVIFSDDAVSRPAAIIAKKILSATGTVECTFSVTDTGDEMWGAVATFKKQSTGGITEEIGLNSETDTAQAFGKSKQKAVGINSETNTAQAVGRSKAKAIGLNTETDTAQTITRRKSKAVGLNSETDSAQSMTRTKSKAIGLVTETDTAQAVASRKSKAIGIASEIDAALLLTLFSVSVPGDVELYELLPYSVQLSEVPTASDLQNTPQADVELFDRR